MINNKYIHKESGNLYTRIRILPVPNGYIHTLVPQVQMSGFSHPIQVTDEELRTQFEEFKNN